MRSIVAVLAAAGLLAAPLAPMAAEPAPPRQRPAPAPRGAPRTAAAPQARPAPSREATRPAPPPSSAAVRPAPPRAGAVSPSIRPAPVPGGSTYPYRRYRHYPFYPYPALGLAPWWGLGWGWGYYPLYQPYAPYPPPAYAPYPPPAYVPYPPPASVARETRPPERVTTQLSIHGGAHGEGGVGSLAVGVEGPRLGFQGSLGAVGEDRARGLASDDAAIVGWGVAHATWSVLSAATYRLRLEAGGSMLSMPDSDAFEGQPYAGTIAFGPSLGVSGHVGVVGPLALEGHARLTPWPVPVADSRVAAAFRGGPFAVTLGWRAIDVSGDRDDGPQLYYSGPELGLSLVF